jgi:hypothetical protein
MGFFFLSVCNKYLFTFNDLDVSFRYSHFYIQYLLINKFGFIIDNPDIYVRYMYILFNIYIQQSEYFSKFGFIFDILDIHIVEFIE